MDGVLGHNVYLRIVLGGEPVGGAEVRHTSLDAGQVPVVVEGGVIDEAHLLLEARHVVLPNQVCGVFPKREPPLPLELAAAGQRRRVGVGQPRLQVGASETRDQDYRVVELRVIACAATMDEADEEGE